MTLTADPQTDDGAPIAPTLDDSLRMLEAEGIQIVRDVVAEFDRPALLFSGGKDSAVLLHLARKALAPAPLPITLVHVDTGHNLPEVIEYRDRVVAEGGHNLVVAKARANLELCRRDLDDRQTIRRHQTGRRTEGTAYSPRIPRTNAISGTEQVDLDFIRRDGRPFEVADLSIGAPSRTARAVRPNV